MQNCIIFFLILSNFFSQNFFENKTPTYINPINNKFIEINYDSKNEINNLLKFIEENSLHDINPNILNDYVIESIVKSIDDEYAYIDNLSSDDFLNSVNGGYNGFGFDLDIIGEAPKGQFVISNVLENSAAFEKGLKAGDIIQSINGIKVYANSKLYEGALDMNTDDSENELSIIRNDKEIIVKLKAKEYTEPAISSRVIDKSIYYIKINNTSQHMPQVLEVELNKIKNFKYDKLIIDLRNNLGGWEDSAIKAAAMMCKQDIIAYQKNKDGISEIDRGDTEQVIAIKPIVLVGKNTASSAELLASCLREHAGATLVGEKTYGKNQSQGVYEFGGRMLKFSNAYISATKEFDEDFSGLEPDVYENVQYEPVYVDKVLEKAIELTK